MIQKTVEVPQTQFHHERPEDVEVSQAQTIDKVVGYASGVAEASANDSVRTVTVHWVVATEGRG